MAQIGVTEVNAVRQSVVAGVIQQALAEKAQLLPLVTDYSAAAGEGMKELSIPRRDLFTAEVKGENSALSDQEMTFSNDTIVFSHIASKASIEDFAKIQSAVDVPSEVVKEIGESLARKVDALILEQLKLASSATPDHLVNFSDAVNYDIALSDITNARKLLRSNGKVMFDDEQAYLLVSPEQEEFMLQLSNLIDASKYGEQVVARGFIGSVMGFKVIVSDLLSDFETIAFHKSAVGFAAQSNFKLEQDRDLSNLADIYAGSMSCGAKVLQAGKRNVFIKSTH